MISLGSSTLPCWSWSCRHHLPHEMNMLAFCFLYYAFCYLILLGIWKKKLMDALFLQCLLLSLPFGIGQKMLGCHLELITTMLLV
jgi:hypothetical protein